MSRALLLLSVAASVLSGQQPAVTKCDSIIAASKVDDVPAALFLHVRRSDGFDADERQLRSIVGNIGAVFTPPKPLRLGVFSGPSLLRGLRQIASDTSPGPRAPTVTGIYRYMVRAADTVPRVTVIRESMLVGFDSAAIEAIVAGNAIRSALDSAVASDSLRVDVRFSTDSLPGAVRLFSTRFPRMPIVDAAPRSSNPAAAYPEAAMADSLSGEVVLRFVVGRDGTPEFRTVELVRATARAFVQAALEALDRQRFTPATIHGCAVAQQIDYPFTFVFPESPPRH